MKKNYKHTTRTLALQGAMAAGLWGCQTDDLAEQVGDKIDFYAASAISSTPVP